MRASGDNGRVRTRGTFCVATALALTAEVGCTNDDDGDRARPAGPTTATASAPRTASPTSSPTPTPVDPVSIPALIGREHRGSGLRLGEVLARTAAYTSYEVTYESDGLTISGLMNIPTGKGPFPALVPAHGYIDPAVYTTGRGLSRAQDLLARNGYVVLHTDYRNHARSDKDTDNDVGLRLGYTENVIGAAMALRSSGRPEIDTGRLGLLGRSMGGGVVYDTLVVAPGLFDAAVTFAPVSAHPEENIDQFQRPGGDPLVAEIEATHGTPETNPRFWREVSPAARRRANRGRLPAGHRRACRRPGVRPDRPRPAGPRGGTRRRPAPESTASGRAR
jgi:pimeloyl-ACP methyl ester carboxylesterase